MTEFRQIQVDIAVYAAIWRNHSSGDQSENDILRRVLAVGRTPSETKQTSGERKKWVDDVLEGILSLGGKGYYSEIYESVKAARIRNGSRIPKSFQAIIRREIEYHSSDSDAYLGKRDLFTAPKGLGAGYWAVR